MPRPIHPDRAALKLQLTGFLEGGDCRGNRQRAERVLRAIVGPDRELLITALRTIRLRTDEPDKTINAFLTLGRREAEALERLISRLLA